MRAKSTGKYYDLWEDIPVNVTFGFNSNFSLETAHKEVGRRLTALKGKHLSAFSTKALLAYTIHHSMSFAIVRVRHSGPWEAKERRDVIASKTLHNS